MRAAFLLLVTIGLATGAPRAGAVEAPFEPSLIRLAEILGSLQFLQGLCGGSTGEWRAQMDALLQSENPPPDRRARFVASFNEGYRAFARTYSSCTPSASAAIALYLKEGEALTRDVTGRYGN